MYDIIHKNYVGDFMKNFDASAYDKDLQRLIHIDNCIFSLYLNRNENNIDETDEKLKFVIEAENEIYKKLDLTKKTSDSLLCRVYFLLFKTDYPEDVKSSINERIANHFFYRCYSLPFASTSKNIDKNEFENSFTINVQVTVDYYKNLLFNLEKSFTNSKNKLQRKILLQTINSINFYQKFLERIDCSQARLEGRERCLMFNHDEKFVDNEYEQFCADIISSCIHDGFRYSNNNLKSVTNKTKFDTTLLSMKTALSILKNDELINVINYYKNEIKSKYDCNQQKSIEVMTSVIEEVIKEKNSVKTKQKA